MQGVSKTIVQGMVQGEEDSKERYGWTLMWNGPRLAKVLPRLRHWPMTRSSGDFLLSKLCHYDSGKLWDKKTKKNTFIKPIIIYT